MKERNIKFCNSYNCLRTVPFNEMGVSDLGNAE